MKKILTSAILLLILIPLGGGIFPALAAEKASSAAKADKQDTKKKDGEGSEASKEPADTSKEGEEKDKEEGGKSKKTGDMSGGRFAGDPVYVHLPPLILPILGATGPEQLVTIQITLQVKNFDTGDEVHSNMPRVMDALMRALYGGLSEGSLRNGRLVDIAKVKSKAVTALQGVLGADNVKDVLIVNMSQRLL